MKSTVRKSPPFPAGVRLRYIGERVVTHFPQGFDKPGFEFKAGVTGVAEQPDYCKWCEGFWMDDEWIAPTDASTCVLFDNSNYRQIIHHDSAHDWEIIP